MRLLGRIIGDLKKAIHGETVGSLQQPSYHRTYPEQTCNGTGGPVFCVGGVGAV